MGDWNVQVRDNYLFEDPTGTSQDWVTLVGEMLALQGQENPNRQYHAFLPPGGLSPGIGGIGYIGLPAAVSIQNEETIAHETGHNLSLPHAPCGGPNYPYAGGKIGVWGYDIETGVLYDPDTYVDLMTYCSPEWISDYNFQNETDFRTGNFGWETDAEFDGAPAPNGTSYIQLTGFVPSEAHHAGTQTNLIGNVAQAKITSLAVVDRLGYAPAAGTHRIVGVDPFGNEVVSATFQTYAIDHADGAGFVVSLPVENLDFLRVTEWKIEKSGTELFSAATNEL